MIVVCLGDGGFEGIEVDSVDGFEGRERKYMIM